MTRTHSVLEVLECRKLLSSVVLDSRGVLRITGDGAVNDFISVGLSGDPAFVETRIATPSGTDSQFFAVADVNRVWIKGLGGNDELFVDEGNGAWLIPTRIDGGPGNDTMRGGASNDQLRGGPGNDDINGFDGRNLIDGGAGSDNLVGGGEEDLIIGGQGNDNLVGFGGDDVMFGGNGIDTLLGFEGNDIMNGGPGADLMAGSSGNDMMLGGPGNDSMTGEEGDDLLFGDQGADTLLGGLDNDMLFGGGKKDQDVIDGGEGENTILTNRKLALKKMIGFFLKQWAI